MAITPNEALKLNEEELGKLAEWEVVIDANIRQQFTGNNEPYVDISGLGSRLVPHLIARYVAVGWTVTPESNQRDGCYLKFKRALNA